MPSTALRPKEEFRFRAQDGSPRDTVLHTPLHGAVTAALEKLAGTAAAPTSDVVDPVGAGPSVLHGEPRLRGQLPQDGRAHNRSAILAD